MRDAFEPEPPQGPFLAIVRGTGRGTILPILLRETLIGRLDTNHIILEDASLSRIHARLWLSDAGVEIEDLGSRVGTVVNGRRIEGRRPLADGDELVLGDVALVFSAHPHSASVAGR
jgi:pSer/pThr/pTyr-binding forkhead associated (FHA) protein